MNQQPVISVRGEAQLEVEPEIADVVVTIQARDRDREQVLARLASRNQQVMDLVKSFGEAVEKLESRPASVRPDFREKKAASERVTGYLGSASLHITIRDFAILGDLVTRLSHEELVTVAGPWWALRPDSPVHRDARLAAARDAQVRAREYAEAFGGSLAALLEVADQGMLTSSGDQGFTIRSRAYSAAAATSPELDFEPARQSVTAQIEARFTMTTPTPTT